MHEAPSKRLNRIPYILLMLLIIISLPFSPLFQPFGYDREIFRYVGMLITKGYVPYRDVFDHKPPVIYFIAALAHLFGPWGFWIVSNCLTYVTSLVIFKYARSHFKSYAFTIVVPIIYIFLSRYEPIYEGGGLTREFSQVFATLIVFTRFKNQNLRFLIIGLLYGLIFLTQQNEILAITPVIAYYILWNNEIYTLNKFSTVIVKGVTFFIGAVITCGMIAGYFYFNHAFHDFIEQAFLFNRSTYVQSSFYDSFSTTWLSYYYAFPNITLFAILYIFFAKKSIRLLEYSVFFLAMFIQLLAASMGHNFGHYYLSFIPYFCYATLFALTQFEDKVDIGYHRIVATAAFFLFITPMFVILRFKAISEHKYWSYYVQRNEVYDKVKDIKGREGQLFVFNNPGYLALNTDLDCPAKSKLVYFHFYNNPDFDKGNKKFFEMVETLQKSRCKYIIDFSGYVPVARKELQGHWDWFLNTNYHVIYENLGNYRLLQIN